MDARGKIAALVTTVLVLAITLGVVTRNRSSSSSLEQFNERQRHDDAGRKPQEESAHLAEALLSREKHEEAPDQEELGHDDAGRKPLKESTHLAEALVSREKHKEASDQKELVASGFAKVRPGLRSGRCVDNESLSRLELNTGERERMRASSVAQSRPHTHFVCSQDRYGWETSWELIDIQANKTIGSGPPEPSNYARETR